MAKQAINLGATGTGAGGDTIRTALTKANQNFDELYIAALPGTAAQKLAARAMFELVRQLSREDTTGGALLEVGSFGLGANGLTPPGDDCNQISVSGFYRLGSASANAFPGKISGDVVIHAAYSSGYGVQIGASRSGLLFSRYNVNGTWGGWSRLFSSANLIGVVSQSSGAPTGSVIERGSNANGEYVRFADGTQICTGRVAVSGGGVVTVSSAWTYPATFAGYPDVSARTIGAPASGARERSEWTGTPGSASVTFSISMNVAFPDPTTFTMSCIAIGRWF